MATEVWKYVDASTFETSYVPDIYVRVVRDDTRYKVLGFREKAQGLLFRVLIKRTEPNGKRSYNVDLSPLFPGRSGFMWETEVEEVPFDLKP